MKRANEDHFTALLRHTFRVDELMPACMQAALEQLSRREVDPLGIDLPDVEEVAPQSGTTG